jgi:hypothetical protein
MNCIFPVNIRNTTSKLIHYLKAALVSTLMVTKNTFTVNLKVYLYVLRAVSLKALKHDKRLINDTFPFRLKCIFFTSSSKHKMTSYAWLIKSSRPSCSTIFYRQFMPHDIRKERKTLFETKPRTQPWKIKKRYYYKPEVFYWNFAKAIKGLYNWPLPPKSHTLQTSKDKFNVIAGTWEDFIVLDSRTLLLIKFNLLLNLFPTLRFILRAVW